MFVSPERITSRKTWLSIVLFFLLLLVIGCFPSREQKFLFPTRHRSNVEVTPKTHLVSEVEKNPTEWPDEINLGIPFYSQAPFGNWGMPYQEACEEASLLLAYYYSTGKTVDIHAFEQDLLAMVEWEKGYFGQYEHTSIEQTAEMGEKHLGLASFEILENPTVDDLKRELAQGHAIVAPFAGRYLGNPYYTGAGPIYHMLVIRGYDEKHFITNDVGTRRGENFIYTYNKLMNALHDWHPAAMNDPEGILKGGKKVLVVSSMNLQNFKQLLPGKNRDRANLLSIRR